MKKETHYCDRCGDQMHKGAKLEIRRPVQLFFVIPMVISQHLDLCPSCGKELKQFLEKPTLKTIQVE